MLTNHVEIRATKSHINSIQRNIEHRDTGKRDEPVFKTMLDNFSGRLMHE